MIQQIIRISFILLLITSQCYAMNPIVIGNGSMEPALDKWAHFYLGSTTQAWCEKRGLTPVQSFFTVLGIGIAVELCETQLWQDEEVDLSDIAWVVLGSLSWRLADGVYISFRRGQ